MADIGWLFIRCQELNKDFILNSSKGYEVNTVTFPFCDGEREREGQKNETACSNFTASKWQLRFKGRQWDFVALMAMH